MRERNRSPPSVALLVFVGVFFAEFFFFTCKSGFYLAMDLWVYVHMDFGFVCDCRCIDFLVIVKVCLAIAVGIG